MLNSIPCSAKVGRRTRLAWLGYNITLHDDNPSEVAAGAEGEKNRYDGEKKEGTNSRMMRNLYPGATATATDTMIGCYLTWESAIGRANMNEEYNRRTVST